MESQFPLDTTNSVPGDGWKEGLLRPVELRGLVSVAHAVLSKVSLSQSLNVNYVQSLSRPSQVSPVLGTREVEIDRDNKRGSTRFCR